MKNEGHLSYVFSTSNIRCIPKKENPSQITNWRPICLLPVCYKVISSALTTRITRVINKLVGSDQKAYSSEKTIHYTLLIVLNSIHKANLTNANMALALIDFRKAFDKVSHRFILESLAFFNFGPNFIAQIKTLLSGRRGGDPFW